MVINCRNDSKTIGADRPGIVLTDTVISSIFGCGRRCCRDGCHGDHHHRILCFSAHSRCWNPRHSQVSLMSTL